MSQYYMLLKNKRIDFEKILLDEYAKLNLNEIDAIILIKLNRSIEEENKIDTRKIALTMAISEEELRNRIVSLINNEFITLTLSASLEKYSLDETYKKLAQCIEKNEEKDQEAKITSDMQNIVSLLEKEFQKILTPLDLEVVHHWVYKDKYPYDVILDAVLSASKLKKKSVKYVDVVLNSKTSKTIVNEEEGLQELFNKVYGKIR